MTKTRTKEYSKAYYQINREAKLAKTKQWQKNNPEKVKKISTQWYKANSDIAKQKSKRWRIENQDKVYASNAKRRATKLQRTVAWANLDKIRDIYSQCEEINLTAKTAGCTDTFSVDHIIPLQGEFVSGLHVEYNLDIITLSDNSRKGNKFTPE